VFLGVATALCGIAVAIITTHTNGWLVLSLFVLATFFFVLAAQTAWSRKPSDEATIDGRVIVLLCGHPTSRYSNREIADKLGATVDDVDSSLSRLLVAKRVEQRGERWQCAGGPR